MQCEKDLREYIFFLIFFFNFNSNSYFVTPILASSLLFSRDADSHSGLKLRNILLKNICYFSICDKCQKKCNLKPNYNNKQFLKF